LTPPPFIEVPVPSYESEWYMYFMGINFANKIIKVEINH